jgi:hypothetical protein
MKLHISGENKISVFVGAQAQPIKKLEAISNPNFSYRYSNLADNFLDIPDSPIAYWVTSNIRRLFKDCNRINDIAEPRQGMATSDNNRFLRLWTEVDYNKIGFLLKSNDEASISDKKWFPYNKGGEFRKWYGNNEYLINWENDGFEVKEYAAKLYKSYTRTIKNIPYYFKEGITYTL